MDQPRIEALRDRLMGLRGRLANIKPREAVSLAEAIGRVRRKGGKEPTYVMHGRPPCRIPSHGSGHQGSLVKWTAKSILDLLEEDLDWLQAELDEAGRTEA